MTESTALATKNSGAAIIEQVIIQGDLAKLSPIERVSYYREVCASLSLNPLTKPFEYITLNGKLTLYALKTCTDQLRGVHGVSITKLERQRLDDLYVVTAYAESGGRQDSSMGVVNIKGLQGESLANALMKAETKAKRRVTLSLCGLGWADESEVDSIPSAQTVVVDPETGAITPPPVMILSPDSTAWKRWLEVTAEAKELGLELPKVVLPIARDALIAAGQALQSAIGQRRDEMLRRQVEEDSGVVDSPSAASSQGSGEEPSASPDLSPAISDALERNLNLHDTARELGVRGLGPFKAQPDWPIEKIEAANVELSERIREKNRDLDATIARQAGQAPAF
jgi:hypothetical protein